MNWNVGHLDLRNQPQHTHCWNQEFNMRGFLYGMSTAGRILVTLILLAPFFFSAAQANAAVSGDMGSVGVISSVSGNAQITHSTAAQQADQPKFHGPIIYGDHLSTSKDSTLGLLVGQNSLLTMRELSDVRIAETTRNKQVLEMVSGRACLAVGQSATTEPLVLKTATTMVTIAPGTLLSVDVTTPPQKSALPSEPSGDLVTLVATSAQGAKQGKTPVVETYQVVEGSVDIISLASGSSAISLRAGQSLQVTGGVRGQPVAAPPIDCRAQDIQIIPSHTAIPAPAQHTIVKEQLQTSSAVSPTERVAAMSQPSVSQSFHVPTDVIATTTTAITDPNRILGSTHTTISVRLP